MKEGDFVCFLLLHLRRDADGLWSPKAFTPSSAGGRLSQTSSRAIKPDTLGSGALPLDGAFHPSVSSVRLNFSTAGVTPHFPSPPSIRQCSLLPASPGSGFLGGPEAVTIRWVQQHQQGASSLQGQTAARRCLWLVLALLGSSVALRVPQRDHLLLIKSPRRATSQPSIAQPPWNYPRDKLAHKTYSTDSNGQEIARNLN